MNGFNVLIRLEFLIFINPVQGSPLPSHLNNHLVVVVVVAVGAATLKSSNKFLK
jgi:hypothetical protein